MTDRERFEVSELRLKLWSLQGGKCATCGRVHAYPETMELAHRIPQDRPSLALYGRRVIHHPLNLRAVCRGSDACNSKQSLRNRPVATRRLVGRIREALGEPVVEI